MARALVNLPKTAKAGDIIEIKTLIAHPMETGFRPGPEGKILPRNIVTAFVCRYGDMEVFSADLFPAGAANPYLTFTTVATTSGTLTFTWRGDGGFEQTDTATITVT